MLQKIDPKTLHREPLHPHWRPVDAYHRRYAGALQYYDRQLGRRGCHVGGAFGGHLSISVPSATPRSSWTTATISPSASLMSPIARR